jgi:hypothetical protein
MFNIRLHLQQFSKLPIPIQIVYYLEASTFEFTCACVNFEGYGYFVNLEFGYAHVDMLLYCCVKSEV